MGKKPLKSDESSEVMGVRMQLVTYQAWMRWVDEWRAKQPDIPSRSKAIRALVRKALGK